MIPQRNISLLSNRLAREGGRRIPESVLERDYCLAWFLVGLSRSTLREKLVFKGGTALKRCYFGDYRFSEDLDFTLAEELSISSIRDSLESVYDEVRRSSGVVFQFSRENRKKHLNSYTFFLTYEGPLPSATGASAKQVKIDITLSERLVCPLQERLIVRGYDEYVDLPEDSTIWVYALDEIAVEKVVALTDRARNEPRDLYDVWYLTSEGHVERADHQSAIGKRSACGRRRGPWSSAASFRPSPARCAEPPTSRPITRTTTPQTPTSSRSAAFAPCT